MLGKLKLLGILLAIPLLGYLVLGWVRSKQEHEWHQALEQTIKNVLGVGPFEVAEFMSDDA